MEATEEIFLEQKGQFLDALDALEATRAPSAPTPASRPESISRKMPTISLPQFSGKYAEWAPFKDMFTAFLTHDAKLTNAERLYYLKSSLSGEAADLIKNIPITDDNYARAWTRLTTHYDNKRKLIHLCLESLFQLAPASTESSSALKALRNGTTEVRETLAGLQRPVDKMDDLLVHLTVRRLDSRTRRDWELSLGDTSTPTRWEELDSFLKSRIEALEMSSEQKSTQSTGDQSSVKKAAPAAKKSKPPALTVHNATTTRIRRCSYCQGEHYINICEKFLACSLDNRHKIVSEKQLCFNCLGVHRIADCRSKGTCATCRGRHHTLLHRESTSQTQVTSQANSSKDRPPNELAPGSTTATSPTEPTGKTCLHSRANANATASHAAQTSSKPRAVLLATALVQVSADQDRTSYARALVDPCSEASFMAESLAQRIRASRQSAFVPVTGVGATPSYVAKTKTAVLISPHFKSSPRWKLTALILPRLTDYVATPQSVAHSDTFMDGLTLADPMNTADPIEIIIGADLYPQLLEEGIRKGTDDGIIAQATGLGWILTGAISTASSDPSTVSSFSCHVDLDLASLLTRFWQQEEVVLKKSTPLPKEERECEDHFIATHKRDADGRYVLRLPFKSNLSELGNSKEAALRALLRTENRFRKQPEFQEKYEKFMQEYISLGHMKEFSSLDAPPTDKPFFLLPHHGIFKTHGDTSKLRVVFNGSVKLPSGLAINDCLYVGPKLQLDPFDVILRWRAFRHAFSADIKKMFRRIRIAEEDQVYQQIVWRIGLIIIILNLCTVTYGLGPSPYQALRTLKQLVIDEGAKFPRAAQVLLDQTYVDDIFAGADTLDEALALKTELVELLDAGGFPLGKWTANDPALLADVPEEEQASTQLFSWSESQTIAILGLAWQPLPDVFCFRFDVSANEENLTKRQALSIIAQLYDPVGWITPVTISFKIFMQSLWYDGIEWDSPLPSALRHRWRLLVDDLPHLQHFSVPRWTGSSGDIVFAEIHAFSDASERAFAACLYLRTVNKGGNVQCILLASKSKVAPLKQVSLPRLELCGAVMLVRLASRVRQTLRLENAQCFCWTDSTITLAWIKQEPTTWKTYVANRVSKIQTTLPGAVWLHIPGAENPADLPSRGILASDLAKFSLWIHGPAFLIGSSAPWNRSSNYQFDDLPEPLERRAVSCLATRANLGSRIHCEIQSANSPR